MVHIRHLHVATYQLSDVDDLRSVSDRLSLAVQSSAARSSGTRNTDCVCNALDTHCRYRFHTSSVTFRGSMWIADVDKYRSGLLTNVKT